MPTASTLPRTASESPGLGTWTDSRIKFSEENTSIHFTRRLCAGLLLLPLLGLLIIPLTALAAETIPVKDLPLPGQSFLVEDHAAFLIPAKVDPSSMPKPWIWYAPTLTGLPGPEERWMFEQWLDAGIAIAGIDVGESYGSPTGRRLFTAMHAEMVGARGYSAKPVLLGRSRGGLMTLCWAVENPEKVAAFAGIYPVCDIASYPGVDKAAPAYGFQPEELEERLAEHNPIERLAGLASAGVPLFAIHGNVDEVVPLGANSGLLKDRYQALHGWMDLIIPPGHGHSMWTGFFQNQELVDFVRNQADGFAHQTAEAFETKDGF